MTATTYYDPFSIQEEEDFWEMEAQRNRVEIRRLIADLLKNDDFGSSSVRVPFPLDQDLLINLLGAIVVYSRNINGRDCRRQLTKLSFSHLRTAGVMELARCLPLFSLRHLSLSSCCGGLLWSSATAEAVLRGLTATNSSLVSLDLSRNNLRNVDPSIFGEWLPRLPGWGVLSLLSMYRSLANLAMLSDRTISTTLATGSVSTRLSAS